jgi:ABC-2 type transport system permease protein
MNSIAFWTLETFAIQMMVRWISDLLSGQIVPLIFFPGIWQALMLGLPFAAIYSTPLLIYVGTIGPERYAAVLLLQLVWLGVFAVAAALMWRAARQRVVVQGG